MVTTNSPLPRYDEDAEKAVLGALLIDADRTCAVLEQLNAADFYSQRHQSIFESIEAVYRARAPVDFLTVKAELEHRGTYAVAGGEDYLVSLAQGVASTARANHFANVVLAGSQMRAIEQVVNGVRCDVFDASITPTDVARIVDGAQADLGRIVMRSHRGGPVPIAALLDKAAERVRNPALRAAAGLPTGLIDLDEKIGGLRRGELIVVGARPSAGKTALALGVATNCACSADATNPRTVLIFSLEMPAEPVVERLIVAKAGINGFVPPDYVRSQLEYESLDQAVLSLRNARMFIDETASVTPNQMRSRARQIKLRHGLDLVVVDYLQLVQTTQRANRTAEVTEISLALKALARDLDVPVIALCQLSRAVEGREPPIPVLADLRDSGSIEQDADVALLLYRLSTYPKWRDDPDHVGKADLIIAKHRNGPTGAVRLSFDAASVHFENLTPAKFEILR